MKNISNNKNIKHKGFTLSELLVVLFIVSFLIALGLMSFRNFDKGITYVYSATYHSLDRAFFNAMSFSSLPNPFANVNDPNESFSDDNKTGLATIGSTEGQNNERVRRLCKKLTEYIDTAYDPNCDAPTAGLNGPFDYAVPNFIAINGTRFYISQMYPDADHKTANDVDFFLVYADLNGEKQPNSMEYSAGSGAQNDATRTKDPDTFAFAILNIARVCPIGVPEVEMRYMKTRISYHDATGEGDNENNISIKFSTISKPYYISKAEAWGYYLSDGHISDDSIRVDDNPYMYNGYIKSKIDAMNGDNPSEIYKFLVNNQNVYQTFPRADRINNQSNGIHLMSRDVDRENPSQGEYGCQEGSDEECDVIIEKYVY